MFTENLEMLKALYDFSAVYPKTISFEESEFFLLYQTSARQRNWWQVINMKGNIGFVPSNYVMKLKVREWNLFLSDAWKRKGIQMEKVTDLGVIYSFTSHWSAPFCFDAITDVFKGSLMFSFITSLLISICLCFLHIVFLVGGTWVLTGLLGEFDWITGIVEGNRSQRDYE